MYSIGVMLFACNGQIHFFNEVGYLHNPFMVHHWIRHAVQRSRPERFVPALPSGRGSHERKILVRSQKRFR